MYICKDNSCAERSIGVLKNILSLYLKSHSTYQNPHIYKGYMRTLMEKVLWEWLELSSPEMLSTTITNLNTQILLLINTGSNLIFILCQIVKKMFCILESFDTNLSLQNNLCEFTTYTHLNSKVHIVLSKQFKHQS